MIIFATMLQPRLTIAVPCWKGDGSRERDEGIHAKVRGIRQEDIYPAFGLFESQAKKVGKFQFDRRLCSMGCKLSVAAFTKMGNGLPFAIVRFENP
jgi:hypothetical protein